MDAANLCLIISLLLLSSACTATGPERSPPIPFVGSVAIESKGATDDLKARFGVAPEDKIGEKSAAAGAGAVAGGLAGTASDMHKTPPDEQLRVLDQLFADIYQQRTLHMEIRNTLENQLPADRLADTSAAEALVQLSLSDVRFTRTFSGKYEWTLKSIMVVTWNRNTGRARHSYKFYEHASRALSLDDWMQNDGEMLNQGLDESVAGLAAQMAGDIRFKN